MKWIVTGLAGAAALGVAAYVYLNAGNNEVKAGQAVPGRASQVVRSNAVGAAAPSEVPGIDAPRGSPADAAPAWMQNAPAKSAAGNAALKPRPDSAAPEEKKAKMDAAFKRLQQLQSAGVTDSKQVSEAILQLEQANGSSVMQGVRLDVLRQNLQVAEKIRALAQELNTLQQSPKAATSAETNTALRAKLDQLEALNKQLRTDVLQTNTSGGAAK